MHSILLLARSLGLATFAFTLFNALPARAQDNGFFHISDVKGSVKIRRVGRTIDPLAHIGAPLRSNDKLILGNGASATVMCQNARRWNIKSKGSFSVAQGCGTNERIILTPIEHSDRLPVRNLRDDSIPFMISPRGNSAVLASKPLLLQWNPVMGANRYRVHLCGFGLNWQTMANRAQILYSGEPLKPGRYFISVVTEDNPSLKCEEAHFRVLNEKSAALFKQDLSALQGQVLSDEAKVLAIAHLERSYELYADAISRLEQAIKTGKANPAFLELLGDLYWQVELPQFAHDKYSAAIALLRKDPNPVAQAEILMSLARIDEGFGNRKRAIDSLSEALQIYLDLGDPDNEKAVQVRLDVLNK